jgi:hypothetical protein
MSFQADEYVNRFSVGLAIDVQKMEVALLRKKRGPEIIVGRLVSTAVAAANDLTESPVGCIRREALEELGLDLSESGQWQQFHFERHQSGKWLYFSPQTLKTCIVRSGP